MSVKLTALVIVSIAAGSEPRDDRAVDRAPIKLTFTAYSSDTTRVGVHDEAAPIDVEAAWVSVQDIRLRAVSDCRRAGHIAIDGPITAELVERRASGPPDTATVEVGSYCSFDVTWGRSRGKMDGAPPELKRASIVILGKRADGIPFILRSRLDLTSELVVEDLEGVAVNKDGIALVVGADLARWMDGIDLTTADTGDDKGRGRSIRIDAHNNAELLARFQDNVTGGLALFRDDDGDRALGTDERRRPIATGGG